MNDHYPHSIRKKTGRTVKALDASTLIIIRGSKKLPFVLLGRRPLESRFMPGYHVFPGGKFSVHDDRVIPQQEQNGDAIKLLSRHCSRRRSIGLVWTAIRETWEETSLLVGRPIKVGEELRVSRSDAIMQAFLAEGLMPSPQSLLYVARAITPTSSPVRFNTRFFLVNYSVTHGCPQDSTELSNVAWRPIESVFREETVADVTKFALKQAFMNWKRSRTSQPISVPTMFHRQKQVIVRNVSA